MAIERKAVLKALRKKGFREDSARDHIWYHLYVDDKKSLVATRVSRGKARHRDLGDDLVWSMARQLHLSVSDFKRFVSCTISAERYVEILRAAGVDP